jgi:hypothetical protein
MNFMVIATSILFDRATMTKWNKAQGAKLMKLICKKIFHLVSGGRKI